MRPVVFVSCRFARDLPLEGGGFELLVLKWTAYRENGDVERFWGLHPPRDSSARPRSYTLNADLLAFIKS
jgi:hypothetical protein